MNKTKTDRRTPHIPGPTLATAISFGGNALNFLRLILASMVIVAHSWPISGHGAPLHRLGEVAVLGFFTISGYLIAGSREHLTWWRYSLRRAGRILPALWVCVSFTAFVLAPISTILNSTNSPPCSAPSNTPSLTDCSAGRLPA